MGISEYFNKIDVQKTSKNNKLISFERVSKHNYKINWIVLPIILIFLIFLAIARLTVVGAFIDDIVFGFLFGIYKYFIYLFILLFSFSTLFGYKIKFFKRGKLLLFFALFLFPWIFSNVIFIYYIIIGKNTIIDNNYLSVGINEFFSNWYNHSLFNSKNDPFLIFWGYENIFLDGGGIIGFFLASLFSMLTVIFSLFLSITLIILLLIYTFGGFDNFILKKKIKKLEEKKLKEHHENVLKNSHIINKEFPIMINDIDEIFKDEKMISINNTNKKSENIIEELLNLNEYSSYVKEDFQLNDENPDYNNFDNEYIDNQEKNLNNNENQINDDIVYDKNDQDDFSFDNDKSYENNNNNIIEDNRKQVDEINNLRAMGNDYQYNNYENNKHEQESDIDEYYENETNNIFNNDDNENSSSNANMDNFIKKRVFYEKKYLLPKLELFDEITKDNKVNYNNWENANFKAEKIRNTFEQFNVLASIQSINVGPQVTKFEILPDPGIKVKKILALENDLKLSLATNNLRIEAPIPEKPFIGLEVPNKETEIIQFKNMLKNIPTNLKEEKLILGIGKTIENQYLYLKISELPHLLIAGTTGSGKSVCIKGIISSLITHEKPTDLKLLLIDPKRVEMKVFSELPHLLAPIIYDYKKAIRALKFITLEMEIRYKLFSNVNVNNIDSYNKKNKFQKLPKIVVIIDELADLMILSKNEVEGSIIRITQMARAAGIHLIIATQRPSTDIITGIIKTNIPSRISFYVSSSIDSRTILDKLGAEKLISKGDMLYSGVNSNNLLRVQGIYISDDEIENLVSWWKKQTNSEYNDELIEFLNETNDIDRGNDSYLSFDKKDELYESAKELVNKFQKASVSLLQKHFSIGYIRASKIIDMLEKENIIGPQNGSKSREVIN